MWLLGDFYIVDIVLQVVQLGVYQGALCGCYADGRVLGRWLLRHDYTVAILV